MDPQIRWLTHTGREVSPSGLKPNSRISTRNPLLNSLTRGQPPLPQPKPWGRGGAKRLSVVLYQRIFVCIRVGTSSHWPLRTGHFALANRKPEGLLGLRSLLLFFSSSLLLFLIVSHLPLPFIINPVTSCSSSPSGIIIGIPGAKKLFQGK